MNIMRRDSSSEFVRDNWREPVEVIRPRILKDQMQSLGLGRPLINLAIQTATTGYAVGAFRDGDKSLAIYAAFTPEERNNIELLSSMTVWSPAANKAVPLGTVFSNLETVFEDNIIMRRDRSRYITAMSEVKNGVNADAMLARIKPEIEAIPLPLDGRNGCSVSSCNLNHVHHHGISLQRIQTDDHNLHFTSADINRCRSGLMGYAYGGEFSCNSRLAFTRWNAGEEFNCAS